MRTQLLSSDIKSQQFNTNLDLIVVHSNLYSPAYQGQGKWVIFNPATRDAFLAVGKDRLPEIIRLLAFASGAPVTVSQIKDAGITVEDSQIEQFVRRGLLQYAADKQPAQGCENFLQRYQQAVFDYPFRDYGDADWREKDQAQMATYARISLPPPVWTHRSGTSYALPNVVLPSDNAPLPPGGPLDLFTLALLLRYTFGSIGIINGGAFGPWLRKTSPSGGARHPTEGVVFLPRQLGDVPAGFYVYDGEHHRLVREENTYNAEMLLGVDDTMVCVIVRSRLERPMWRYRDVRAFRPVLIDAGHCIETLSLLAGYYHLSTKTLHPIAPTSFIWIEEPEIAMVAIGHEAGAIKNLAVSDHFASPDPVFSQRDPYQHRHFTNPCMYLTFAHGKMKAHALWPSRRETEIDLVDFNVLTHCLFSRREDRITTQGALVDLFQISPKHMGKLREAGALLPYEIGKPLFVKSLLWARHSWYLSLLAHLEVRASGREDPPVDQPVSRRQLTVFSSEQLPRALLQRKTTRSFSLEPITLEQVQQLLQEACSDLLAIQAQTVKVFAALLNVQDKPLGVYEWDALTQVLRFEHDHISHERIRELTIGQECAGAGALTLWLVQHVDLCLPGCYEHAVMVLGRIGQRLCLAAAICGLGIFMTPAVSDKLTCQALGILDPLSAVVYSFTVGRRRES